MPKVMLMLKSQTQILTDTALKPPMLRQGLEKQAKN